MKDNQIDDYEEYVQPPSYIDSKLDETSEPLINKLRSRINKDINQINGVYDTQISDLERQMNSAIERIKEQYTKKIVEINLERKKDIEKYNSKAEYRIENLIISIENPSTIMKKSFISWILGM